MCSASLSAAGFRIAAIGSMSTARPATIANPVGVFIHPLAMTTNTPDIMPATATPDAGEQVERGDDSVPAVAGRCRGRWPRVKNAKPSSANGRPKIGPAKCHEARPQRAQLEGQHGARHRADGEQDGGALGPAPRELRDTRDRGCAATAPPRSPSSSGIAMPATANRMWNAERDRHLERVRRPGRSRAHLEACDLPRVRIVLGTSAHHPEAPRARVIHPGVGRAAARRHHRPHPAAASIWSCWSRSISFRPSTSSASARS